MWRWSMLKVLYIKKVAVVFGHALLGWALCAATIGICFQLTSLMNALIIHAVGAPVFFFLVSRNYFKRFSYTSPIQTASVFVVLVVFMDFFIVALLIQRSLAMFTSLLGTWIPFVLIFLSTHLTGLWWRVFRARKAPVRM
jgi:hypothetical protein